MRENIFFLSFKVTLKIHFLSESIKNFMGQNLISNQLVII
jgi:hypothetical protein